MQSLYRDVAPVPSFLLAHYADLGLSDADMLNMARLFACQEQGSDAISPELLKRHFAGREDELSAFLATMESKGMITRDDFTGAYRLDGLYQHLLELWVFNSSVPTADKPQYTPQEQAARNSEAIKTVYALFEAEFARPLSPIELQKLNSWLINDGWSAPMLAEAVSRAVMHGAFSLAYIDKILLRWQKAGITTPEKLAAEEPMMERKRPGGRQTKARAKAKVAEPSYSGDADYSKYI